jgi:hypothetical protein
LFFPKPVAFSAERVDLGLHPAKQQFGRYRVDPGPLELEDVLALPSDLKAHTLDFGTNMFKLHHGLAWFGLFNLAPHRDRRLAFPFQEPQTVP